MIESRHFVVEDNIGNVVGKFDISNQETRDRIEDTVAEESDLSIRVIKIPEQATDRSEVLDILTNESVNWDERLEI